MHPPKTTGLLSKSVGRVGPLSIGRLAGRGAWTGLPWVTATLMALLGGVYAATLDTGPIRVDTLVRWGAKAGPLVTEVGQGWRLLVANLLHRDLAHLGLNLLVLVVVGTTVERTLRRRDYVALLLGSALGTMAGSLWWSSAVSVGASGMIFGCVGALLVLGRKPRGAGERGRYRWFSGEGALPTVLVFLWLGWTSAGVDNAGHLGGLLTGLLAGTVFSPRELDGDVTRASRWLRPVGVVALAVGVAVGVTWEGSGWQVERDDGFGVAVSLPAGWRREEDAHGRRSFSNGLPGLGRATFSAEAIEAGEPGDGEVQARHFLADELVSGVPGPHGQVRSASGPEATMLGGRAAQRVRAEVEGGSGATSLRAWFVPRGEWVYRLVFTWPASYPSYAAVVDRMVAELRLEEPATLREARARALLVPGAVGPLRALGSQLRRWGLAREAVEPLASAVRLAPADVPTRVELARALFESGQVEEGCHAAAEARVYGPSETAALEAGVRCELARGDAVRALARLEEARQVDPRDARLRAAEAALRAALEAPGP
ncbi:rhomboid family intramembrane serine protease [Myxococcaceae bacterium JPH2]|nr:rhomboid family intramembrane serine protease [Myxococcaceae bacterium JPH2]